MEWGDGRILAAAGFFRNLRPTPVAGWTLHHRRHPGQREVEARCENATVAVDTVGYLTWSPDSAYVYYDTFLNKEIGSYRFRIGYGKVEKVADLN